MITVDDFLVFTRRTVAGTLAAVDRLGDERINTWPDLPGVSTPYQLVTHAFAAAEYWCSHIVCGHPTQRVRDDEFRASGSVALNNRTAVSPPNCSWNPTLSMAICESELR